MRRPSPLPPPAEQRPEEAAAAPDPATVQPPRQVAPPRRRPSPDAPSPVSADPAADDVSASAAPEPAPDAATDVVPAPPVPGADTATAGASGSAATDLSADEAETAPLAPVIPFHLRDDHPGGMTTVADAGPVTRPAPGAGDATAPPVDAEPEVPREEVGVRDVLRAARARRRALRAEARRFTARQRHRRFAWLGAVAAVVLLVLGTLGVAYSPLFAVETIRVEGTQRLDAAAVEEALSGQLGTPMPLVDSSEVKAALVGFPLVETYALEARPPHELVVRVVERTPIGVLSSAAGFTLVDAAGVALSTTSAPPPGEPVLDVRGGVGSAAFEAVGHVVRSLPAGIRTQVTAVSATTPNDVTLTLGATGTQVVWGGPDKSAMKALALETIMKTRPPETVAAYDVSSPDAIVLR
ncbi:MULTISPECIES: FtsQ-type POTRA domain-containing protein [Microbacterium]|uniref:FtsQ-type POTRA domain-containing protein n=1 Tax=Microbacterium TaxID=33882 RepID=UPI0027D45BAB|nr:MULTISPECIES: FtsQ-type POTRA domain-containing protein [unclassified Microbacterium]